jgi:hypothetical protein
LDNKDFIISDKGNEYNNYIYFLISKNDEVAQICVYNKNAFGETRDWVYIIHYLIQEVSSFFSIDENESVKFIGNWVGNKLGVTPEKIIDARKEGNYRLVIID